jgi:hypothetical protein
MSEASPTLYKDETNLLDKFFVTPEDYFEYFQRNLPEGVAIFNYARC